MEANPSNILSFAATLPVPIVQELAATISSGNSLKDETAIPERYIRPEVENDQVVSPACVDELPVIDLMKLSLDSEHPDVEELSRLGFACREWGFFQLINHGVPEEVMGKTMDDIIEFFKLPFNEREKIKQVSGQIEGYGQVFVHSEDQKLDWADMLSLSTLPLNKRDMRFWPAIPTTFRDTMDRYSFELNKVVGRLCRLMAMDLGANPETLYDLYNDQVQSVRINYYPPCKLSSKVMGLSPHSDGNGITLLFQTNDVQGLQIKKNGLWYPIEPKPGAFIVNIGDIMEILTNGVYKSVEHRAVINENKERISVATFHSPSMDAMLEPLPGVVNGDGEIFRIGSVKDFLKEYLSEKLNGKRALEGMKLKK